LAIAEASTFQVADSQAELSMFICRKAHMFFCRQVDVEQWHEKHGRERRDADFDALSR
jgi:hypothetical protein